MKALRILLSAHACEPNQGSEDGIGWNVAREAARHHEVWVLAPERSRPVIEAELASKPIPGLHFVYCNLPVLGRWWKQHRAERSYYYLWQVGAYFVSRKLNSRTSFDLVHHVTIGKYSVPSFLALLPAPFLWGPLGGGESAPKAYWKGFGLRGIAYETARDLIRWLGEYDPFTRLAARRSVVALAATEETSRRMRKIGARVVQILPTTGLSEVDIEQLGRYAPNNEPTVRFISIGRLLHWKGLHLALQAFAKTELAKAEYWIVGDGPERKRLEVLARKLKISGQVRFFGQLPRQETFAELGKSHVLVHPSLHESGGWVISEAMAASKPVICLDSGGPAISVTEETGYKVPANHPKQTIADLAEAMRRLGGSQELRESMGKAGRKRVLEEHRWSKKGEKLNALYAEITESVKQ